MSSSSDSALLKPVWSVIRVFGVVFDAVYYFFESLISPGTNYRSSRNRLTGSGNSSSGGGGSGPRIATLRRSGGNAPNMNVGCRSCQM